MSDIILTKHKGAKIPCLSEIKKVSYVPVRKVVDRLDIPGLGSCPVMGNTGKFDKSQLSVYTKSGWFTLSATRDGVHEKIRRLRDQESALLESLDKKIAALHAERVEVLKLAWTKANVVTVKELTELID
jgi:hypothetical protein